MFPKRSKDSETITCFTVMPNDMNHQGSLFGGKLLQEIDMVAGMVATRHVRRNCVTASVDRVNFKRPAKEGDYITIHGKIVYTSTRSMEVSVSVEAEKRLTGRKYEICHSYLTFVALDDDDRPEEVPQLLLETDEDRIIFEEGRQRYEQRKRERDASKIQ